MKNNDLNEAELSVDVVKKGYAFGTVTGLVVPEGRAYVPGKVATACGLKAGGLYRVGVVENPKLAQAMGKERETMAPYMVAKVYEATGSEMAKKDRERVLAEIEANGMMSAEELTWKIAADERDITALLMGWWNRGVYVSRCPVSDGPSTTPRGVFWVLKDTPFEDILE